MDMAFPAFAADRITDDQPNHSSYQVAGPYFHVADQVIQLLKQERDLLNEKVALYRAENRRDRKRKLLELYDRHYKTIMLGVGGIAASAVIAAAASAYVNQPQDLTIPQLFAHLSDRITYALLAGTGLVTLLVRWGYFLDCNGKFQLQRRAEDAVKQALVQMGTLERINQVRDINRQLSALPSTRFRLPEKWAIWRLLREIDQKQKKLDQYAMKMYRRDTKVLNKEHKDVGGRPEQTLNRIEAKKKAVEILKGLGVSEPWYFIDQEGELAKENKKGLLNTLSQLTSRPRKKIMTLFKNKQPVHHRQETERERLSRLSQQMKNELKEVPNFFDLNSLSREASTRTEEEVNRIMFSR